MCREYLVTVTHLRQCRRCLLRTMPLSRLPKNSRTWQLRARAHRLSENNCSARLFRANCVYDACIAAAELLCSIVSQPMDTQLFYYRSLKLDRVSIYRFFFVLSILVSHSLALYCSVRVWLGSRRFSASFTIRV